MSSLFLPLDGVRLGAKSAVPVPNATMPDAMQEDRLHGT